MDFRAKNLCVCRNEHVEGEFEMKCWEFYFGLHKLVFCILKASKAPTLIDQDTC
jgi:hypothetical protein